MGSQSHCGTTNCTRGSVRVTNHRRYPGDDINGNGPGMPPTTQGEISNSSHTGHQRANTSNIPSQKKANKTNSKPFNKIDHKGQHTLVTRPAQVKLTEEPQEHKHHEQILSVQINDTQKPTYNAKVSNMEATALFLSGATLSCISKQFYHCIHQLEPSMVINMKAGPAIVITSASADKLINLGQCRLHIKLSPKT